MDLERKAFNISLQIAIFAMRANLLTYHGKYVHFELVNRSRNIVFSKRKKQELFFLITLSEGMEELKVKYTKINIF